MFIQLCSAMSYSLCTVHSLQCVRVQYGTLSDQLPSTWVVGRGRPLTFKNPDRVSRIMYKYFSIILSPIELTFG